MFLSIMTHMFLHLNFALTLCCSNLLPILLLNKSFLLSSLLSVQVMAQQVRSGRRYLRAFVSGFFVAVPVSLTIFDRFACVARVEGASMQVNCSDDLRVTEQIQTVLFHLSWLNVEWLSQCQKCLHRQSNHSQRMTSSHRWWSGTSSSIFKIVSGH